MQQETVMQQNSPQWLEMRKTKIGASDANIIMGVSEYMTPLDLYLEKKNLPPRRKVNDNTFILDKGHYLEDKIRAELELEKGCDFPPQIFIHNQIDYLMASMDGFNEQWNMGIECKYVGQDDYQKVVDWNPGDPSQPFPLPQYYPQIQQQYLCSGAGKIALVAITEQVEDERFNGRLVYITDQYGRNTYKKVIKVVPPNSDYIMNELIPALTNFRINHIDKDIEPGATEADIIEIKNLEVGKKVTEYKNNAEKISKIKEKLKPLEDNEKKLKKEIFDMELVSAPKMTCKGLSLTQVSRQGSVDYKAAYESLLANIDAIEINLPDVSPRIERPNLENFRKANSIVYKISIPKPKKEDAEEKVIDTKITEGPANQGIPAAETPDQDEPKTTESAKPSDQKEDWKNLSPEQQTIQAEANAFKTEKGKTPRGWHQKNRTEKIDYLEKLAKRRDSSPETKKRATNLAEQLRLLN